MSSSLGTTNNQTRFARVGRLQTAEIIAKVLGISSAGTPGVARCPAHDDRTPNLSIRDCELLIRCEAVCERQRVIAVLSHELWLDHSSPWFARSACRSIIDAVTTTPGTPKQLSSFGNLRRVTRSCQETTNVTASKNGKVQQ
jgi:hypothetical protein